MKSRFLASSTTVLLVMSIVGACSGAGTASPTATPTSLTPPSGAPASPSQPAASATVPPTVDVSVQLDFYPSTTYAPLQLGIDKGYFAAEGINLTILPSNGSVATLQQINSNKIQFGFVDSTTYTLQRMQNQTPTTAIYAYFTVPTFAVWSRKPLNSPADMVGTTFGTIPTSAGRYELPFILSQNGVDPSKVTVQLMDFSVLYAQLFKGALDSAETGLPGDESSFLQAQQQHQTLYLIPSSKWGFVEYPKLLIARNDTIQSDPDLVRRLVAGIDHSLQDSLANATNAEIVAASQKLSSQITSDAATLEWQDIKQYESGEGSPMDASVFASTISLLTTSQNVSTTLGPTDLFTNQFLPGQ